MTFKKGHTTNIGRKHSDESIIKMSEKAKERFKDKTNHPWYNRPVTDEHKIKLSTAHKGKHAYLPGSGTPFKKGNTPWNKGIPRSEETKRKISKANSGKIVSEETKNKIKNTMIGRKREPFTEEHKKAISKGTMGRLPWNKGKPHMQKENHPLYGKPRSDETKQKISDANLGKKGMIGDKHPNWKGGVSFEPYCHKFNELLKEQIRERDDRTCQLCGRSETENGRKLDVHHIHYDKPNCDPDLIALCLNCNLKVNFNRDYYENLFMEHFNT